MSNKNNDKMSDNKTPAEAKNDDKKADVAKSAPQNKDQKPATNKAATNAKTAAAKNEPVKAAAAKTTGAAKDAKAEDKKPETNTADAKKEAPKADVKKELPKAAAKTSAPVAKPQKSGAGFGSLLVAALLGGVASIALLGAGGYYLVQNNGLGAISGVMNTSQEAANSDEARYTELSTRVVALEGDVADLREQGENTETSTDTGANSEAASNVDQVNALEAKVQALSDAQTSLTDNVKAIETGLGGGSDAPVSLDNVDAKMVAGLNVEIEKLKTMVAALEAKQAEAPVVVAETASTETSDADAATETGTETVATEDAPVTTAQTNDVAAQIEAQKAEIEAQAAKIAELASQITTVTDGVASNAAAIEKVAETGGKIGSEEANQMAQAVALASLERALQDEKPFADELNAVKSFAKDDATVASLEAFASTGIRNNSSLISNFDALIDQAITADLKGEASSVLDKFLGNAKSMISIRRTGNVKGNDAEAVIARMEVALKDNNLEAAVTEAANLSGPAKDVFEAWTNEATANVEAKTLMRQLSTNILKNLAAN